MMGLSEELVYFNKGLLDIKYSVKLLFGKVDLGLALEMGIKRGIKRGYRVMKKGARKKERKKINIYICSKPFTRWAKVISNDLFFNCYNRKSKFFRSEIFYST